MSDSKTISILKALSWQALGLCTSLLITWLFTGSLHTAGSMTVTMSVTAFVLYFVHERLWARIHRGKQDKEPVVPLK